MPWWAWVVVGALLLGAELAFIDAQFYLVFIGGAALLVGLLDLAGIHIPDWSQWLVFAALSVGLLVWFRKRIYAMTRVAGDPLRTGPAGEEVTIPFDLAPDGSCRVEYRGSTWTAQNKSEHYITAGSQARIVNVDGLTLQIRPLKN